VRYAELSSLLYHGSDISFDKIDLQRSSPHKDFGSGFYTTNDRTQAEKFARLKARRSQAHHGYVEVFGLDNYEGLAVKKFEAANEDWFDFVLCNRGFGSLANAQALETYDIVIGPVANDAVGLVLNQYIAGTYGVPYNRVSKETAIRLLLTQKLHNQVFFGTEQAVARLSFSEVYDVYLD